MLRSRGVTLLETLFVVGVVAVPGVFLPAHVALDLDCALIRQEFLDERAEVTGVYFRCEDAEVARCEVAVTRIDEGSLNVHQATFPLLRSVEVSAPSLWNGQVGVALVSSRKYCWYSRFPGAP